MFQALRQRKCALIESELEGAKGRKEGINCICHSSRTQFASDTRSIEAGVHIHEMYATSIKDIHQSIAHNFGIPTDTNDASVNALFESCNRLRLHAMHNVQLYTRCFTHKHVPISVLGMRDHLFCPLHMCVKQLLELKIPKLASTTTPGDLLDDIGRVLFQKTACAQFSSVPHTVRIPVLLAVDSVLVSAGTVLGQTATGHWTVCTTITTRCVHFGTHTVHEC